MYIKILSISNTIGMSYAFQEHTTTVNLERYFFVEERARDLKQMPVFVLGSSESHTHAQISQMPDLTVTAAAVTAPLAFREAGISPGDIDMAMIYDSFSVSLTPFSHLITQVQGWPALSGRNAHRILISMHALLLDQHRYKACPAGLMTRAKASTVLAVKVLVE